METLKNHIGYLIRTKDGEIRKGAIRKDHLCFYLSSSLFDSLKNQRELTNHFLNVRYLYAKDEHSNYTPNFGNKSLGTFAFHDSGCVVVDAVKRVMIYFIRVDKCNIKHKRYTIKEFKLDKTNIDEKIIKKFLEELKKLRITLEEKEETSIRNLSKMM